jgi:frataxin-like iron-binding protein CyaY
MALRDLNAYDIFFVMKSEFEMFINKSESLRLVWSWVSPGCSSSHYSIIMAARKIKIRDKGDLLAVIEEELANDSDSDAEYVPELSSSSSVCSTIQDKSWLA